MGGEICERVKGNYQQHDFFTFISSIDASTCASMASEYTPGHAIVGGAAPHHYVLIPQDSEDNEVAATFI